MQYTLIYVLSVNNVLPKYVDKGMILKCTANLAFDAHKKRKRSAPKHTSLSVLTWTTKKFAVLL